MAIGDGDDGVHRRLEARGRAGQHGGGRAGAGRLGDLLDRAVLGAGEVLGEAADDLREHEADDDGAEALPAASFAVVVADVAEGNERRCR